MTELLWKGLVGYIQRRENRIEGDTRKERNKRNIINTGWLLYTTIRLILLFTILKIFIMSAFFEVLPFPKTKTKYYMGSRFSSRTLYQSQVICDHLSPYLCTFLPTFLPSGREWYVRSDPLWRVVTTGDLIRDPRVLHLCVMEWSLCVSLKETMTLVVILGALILFIDANGIL